MTRAPTSIRSSASAGAAASIGMPSSAAARQSNVGSPIGSAAATSSNRCVSVPFQHHFGTRSAHEIFAVATGPGIVHARLPVDRSRQQISVAATIGQIMKFPTDHVDVGAGVLEEMLA